MTLQPKFAPSQLLNGLKRCFEEHGFSVSLSNLRNYIIENTTTCRYEYCITDEQQLFLLRFIGRHVRTPVFLKYEPSLREQFCQYLVQQHDGKEASAQEYGDKLVKSQFPTNSQLG